MRYQVGPDGDPLKCAKCGEWLRSSPVFDTFPICARKTCRDAEKLGKNVHDVMASLFGLPDQGDVVTGGELVALESNSEGSGR